MKAKKKPVTIEFFEIKSTHFTPDELVTLAKWANAQVSNSFDSWFKVEEDYTLFVKTLEGTSYRITGDDMIIRGHFGEYYPCKKDVFYKTYEVLDDETQRNR